MESKTQIANIKITRVSTTESDIHIVMPIWITPKGDKKFHIDIPLFKINTFANKEVDIDIAIKEAVNCFIIASKLHGKGFAEELKSLGWQQKRNSFRVKMSKTKASLLRGSNTQKIFGLKNSDMPYIQNMMQTGVSKSFSLQVA